MKKFLNLIYFMIGPGGEKEDAWNEFYNELKSFYYQNGT